MAEFIWQSRILPYMMVLWVTTEGEVVHNSNICIAAEVKLQASISQQEYICKAVCFVFHFYFLLRCNSLPYTELLFCTCIASWISLRNEAALTGANKSAVTFNNTYYGKTLWILLHNSDATHACQGSPRRLLQERRRHQIRCDFPERSVTAS